MNCDEGLREHLLAAGAGQSSAPSPIQQQQPHTGGPQQHIDPAIAGSQHYMSQADPNDDAEGRKGRRELSTSKRAAQNRAAQVRSLLFVYHIPLTLSARVPSAQRGVHQAAQGSSQGVRAPMRAIQGPADRKLPASRLHHQPPIAPARDTNRGAARACRCRSFQPTPRRAPQPESEPPTAATPTAV